MVVLLPPRNPIPRPPAWRSVHHRGREAQELYELLLGSGRLGLIEEPGGRLLANWSTSDGPRAFYVGSPEFTEAIGAFAAERGLPPVSAEVVSELEERLALENPLPAAPTHPENRDRWTDDLIGAPATRTGRSAEPQPEVEPQRPDPTALKNGDPEWNESNAPSDAEPEGDRLEKVLRGLARGGAWIGRPSSLAMAIGEDPFTVAEALNRNNATLAGRGIRVMTRPLGSGWVWVVFDEALRSVRSPRPSPPDATKPSG